MLHAYKLKHIYVLTKIASFIVTFVRVILISMLASFRFLLPVVQLWFSSKWLWLILRSLVPSGKSDTIIKFLFLLSAVENVTDTSSYKMRQKR